MPPGPAPFDLGHRDIWEREELVRLRRMPTAWSDDKLDRQIVVAYLSDEDATTGYASERRYRAAVVYDQDPRMLPRWLLRRTARDLGPDFFKRYMVYTFEWQRYEATAQRRHDLDKEGWEGFDDEASARAAGRAWVGSHGADVPLAHASEAVQRVRSLVRSGG